MRINNNVPSVTVSGSDATKRADRTEAGKSSRADQIQLSGVARSAADAHTEKLQALQMRVESGSYRPSAQEVAGSMIGEMLR